MASLTTTSKDMLDPQLKQVLCFAPKFLCYGSLGKVHCCFPFPKIVEFESTRASYTARPANHNISKQVSVINHSLHKNAVVALPVDRVSRTLAWCQNGDMGAIYGTGIHR